MPAWAIILLAWLVIGARVAWRFHVIRTSTPEYLAFIGEHPWPEDHLQPPQSAAQNRHKLSTARAS